MSKQEATEEPPSGTSRFTGVGSDKMSATSSIKAEHHELFIDGRWTSGCEAEAISLTNPATERACGTVAKAGTADVDQALKAASQGFECWQAMPSGERAEILQSAARRFEDALEDVVVPFTRQQGKPLAEARGELGRALEMFRWTAEAAGADFTRRYPGIGQTRYAIPHPIGVIAAFTPWNYPAVLAVRKTLSALAAGCTVILKAAEEVPAPVVALVRSLDEAGLPPGVVNLLFGDPAAISERLLASPVVSKLTFTGSTAVGRHLAGLASRSLIRCTLELGGHAPVLVFEDADLTKAARSIADYKFECAGQSCNAPSRIYVQDTVFDRFLESFFEVVSAIRVGDGDQEGIQMGPLQHSRRLQAVEHLVADAVGRGARVEVGGSRLDRPGFFFEPTILTGLASDTEILREEPFGPVIPVMPFSTVEDAVEMANRSSYGLAGYCFTASPARAKEVPRRLEVGYVGVNGLSGVPADAPVGGLKDSGYGLEGGREGIEDFLHPKLVTEVMQ